MTENAREALQHAAEEMGFVARWSVADLPRFAAERYEQWLGDRRHGAMGELLRGVAVRFDPVQRFGWVRSALVLAARHAYAAPPRPSDGVRIGQVGRAYWVREQEHLERLIRPRIDALKGIARELDIRCRDWVDQGPLPIRSYAARAGLGWVGRNCMVIAPGLGSYTTLAVLLTELDVAPARQHGDLCGSCRRCLVACPTGALLGDGTLDARRCISYWTTQHPGLIPPSRWEGIGNWLFGCDVCQSVCPWNSKVRGAWADYEPEADLANPDVRTFFSAFQSASDFEQKYAGSAFVRAGRARMARNALILMANADDSAYAPLCALGAADVDPVVRCTAVRALVTLGQRGAAARMRDDDDPIVRREAEAALEGRDVARAGHVEGEGSLGRRTPRTKRSGRAKDAAPLSDFRPARARDAPVDRRSVKDERGG